MRADTQAAIGRLPEKERKRALQHQAAIEEVESRLSDSRKIHLAIGAVLTPQYGQGEGHDLGALVISDYGIHWAGRGDNNDWPWERLQGVGVFERARTMLRRGWMNFEFTPDNFTGLTVGLDRFGKSEMPQIIEEALRAAKPKL